MVAWAWCASTQALPVTFPLASPDTVPTALRVTIHAAGLPNHLSRCFASHPFHYIASHLSPCLASHPSHRLASHPSHCSGHLSNPLTGRLAKRHHRSGLVGVPEARSSELGLSSDGGAWLQILALQLGTVWQPRRALEIAQALEFGAW